MVTDKKLEVLGKIRDYIRTIDNSAVVEIEDASEKELVANFYINGFDAFMISEIQNIAKKDGYKVSFNVEPYSSIVLKLVIVLSEVSEK
ncbi:MAG: hypothetical protein JHC26_11645 [Thermofilum sp.]|uniref:hypothetical protein n=1 Tax=Thermofilum sp. TaxID=1961369 RepID=UPI0025874852|nr:hypothetical protein [Thermofilum sp.]MCI4409736.1 hypothetical protein [Thermofilum sp.]